MVHLIVEANMKKLINLETTTFDFSAVVNELPATKSWDGKGGVCLVPDFGTVFIGLSRARTEMLDEIERAAVGDGPLFLAPEGWRWPQMARALGIFPSASRAASNGWDGDIPSGFSIRRARINKVRGEITFVKIDENSPWV